MTKFAGKYRIPSARAPWWDYANDGAYFVTICTAHRECCFGEVVNGMMKFNETGEIANNIWDEIPRQFPYAELGVYQVMPNHVHGIIVINHTKCGDSGEKRYDVETIDGVTRNDEINDVKTNVGETWDDDTRDDGTRDGYDTFGCCDTRGGNMRDGCNMRDDDETRDGCDTRGGRDAINRVSTGGIAGIIASNAETNASNAETTASNAETTGYNAKTNAPNAETNASPADETRTGGVTGNHNPMLHDNLSRILRWYKGRVTFECHQTDADFGWQARFHDNIIRDTAWYNTISEYIIHNPAKWDEDKFNPTNM